MSNEISVKNLQLFLKKCKITKVVFASENQSDYECRAFPKCSITFNRIEAMNNPSVIFLSGLSGKMQFNCVTKISIDNSSSALGAVIRFCSFGKEYTLLVS